MLVLMRCVAEAVMAKGVRGLVEVVPGGGFLFDVANEALRRLKDRKRADQLREELLQAAQATNEEAKAAAERVAREVAATGSTEDRLALEMYLAQIPGAVRQSLKRAEDPSGKSVPAGFALNEPADLARRLPSRLPRFRPGDPLPGRPGWELAELLGTGGFGEVWLARNPSLSALRGAVKFGLDPQARDRLLRHEGSLVNRVMEQGKHPNVVQLLDAHLAGDAPWLMYEYVAGGDLAGLVLAWQSLPPDERVRRTAAALRTLASAVGHFHRLRPPLVHRDLKPSNILVDQAGGGSMDARGQPPDAPGSGGSRQPTSWAPRLAETHLKVADFGIGGVAAAASLAQEASRRSSTGVLMSQLQGSYTPLYASPQQQRGDPPDPRDDVHALGVIGYQMLTGKLDATLGADYAKTLRRLGVPDPLVELLGDCAAHDPDNRPRDAAELADRLAGLTPGSASTGDDKVVVPCPQCSVGLRVPRGDTRPVRCAKCGHTFRPAVAPPPAAAATPQAAAVERPRAVARPVDTRAEPEPRPEPGRDEDDRPRPRRESAFARQAKVSAKRTGLRIALMFGIPLVLLLGFGAVVLLFRSLTGGGIGGATARSIDGAKIERGAYISGVGSKLRDLSFTPDGKRLMTVTEDGVVGFCELEKGEFRKLFETGIKGHRPALSADGVTLVVGRGKDNTVLYCDSNTGTAEYTLSGLTEPPVVTGYSPDRRWVIAGSGNEVRAWDLSAMNTLTGEPKSIALPGDGARTHPGPVAAVVFDPRGRYLATAGGSEVKVWEVGNEFVSALQKLDAGGTVTALAFSPDGKRLVAGTTADMPRSWDTEKWAETTPKKEKLGPVVRLSVVNQKFPPAVAVATVSRGGDVGFWEPDGARLASRLGQSGAPFVRANDVAHNPADPKMLAIGQGDGTAVIWDTFFMRPRVKLVRHDGAVLAVAWSPDGKRLATADAKGTVIVWSVPGLPQGLDEVEVR